MPIQAMEPHIAGNRILPGTKQMSKLAMRGRSSAAINKNAVVFLASVSGAYPTVTAADPTNAAQSRGRLFIARTAHNAASADVDCIPMGIIQDVNTNGATIGDPVYLGASGAISLTPVGLGRKIGEVLKVGTTDGEVYFDGAPGASQSRIIAGTFDIASGTNTGTITAATLGGSFGGAEVVATLNEVDGVVAVAAATWSTNDLVVTLTANTTGIRTVAYMIAVQ
jgi:hypothetical protein